MPIPQRYEHVVATLSACALECETCARYCMEAADKSMVECQRLCLDCADICRQSMVAIGRNSRFTPAMLSLCADICEACAEECVRFEAGEMQACAEACRTCARVCRQVSSGQEIAA